MGELGWAAGQCYWCTLAPTSPWHHSHWPAPRRRENRHDLTAFAQAALSAAPRPRHAAQGSLRGAGDTRWPFAIETVFGWGVFVPLAYTLGVVLEGGLAGAWTGGMISLGCTAAILVWRFRSGAWRRISI